MGRQTVLIRSKQFERELKEILDLPALEKWRSGDCPKGGRS
jgi:hypothetical protein